MIPQYFLFYANLFLVCGLLLAYNILIIILFKKEGRYYDIQRIIYQRIITLRPASDGHDEFYAHLPYVKDYDLCNWRPLRMHSGNIIKARQCKVNPPVIIDSDPR